MSQVDIPGLPLNTSPPGDSLFEISNSGVSESTRLQDIIFGLQEVSEKDQANGYAGLDASSLLDPAQIPDLSATYQIVSEKDDANGYAGLDGSAQLKLSAYPAGNALEFLRRNAANTGLEFAPAGSASPLTTKGDVFGYDTGNARIPVGTDGQILTANSAQALGVEWTTPVISDTPWIEDHDAAGFRLINVSQYETNATNPAASGAIRLGDLETIAWRNDANTVDYFIQSNDGELIFKNWFDISFIEAEDVSFPIAQVVVSTLQLNGTGELDVGSSQIFDIAVVKSANSGRGDLVLNLGNTEVVSWEKTVPVNGAISITTNTSDEFVIQRSASEAGAFVEEYIFNSTGVDFLSKNLTMGTAYIDIQEISTPANPAVNVGRLYVKDVSSITHLFFIDSAGTDTDLLQSVSPLTTKGDLFTYDTGNQRLAVGADTFVLTADSAEATGLKWSAVVASQTPWVADIDADGFDLNDLSNILFRNTTGSPAGSDVAIYRVSDRLRLNAAATFSVDLGTDGDVLVRVQDDGLALPNGDNITGVGIYKFGANINHEITADGSSIFVDGVTDVRINVNNTLEYLFSATIANFQGNNLTNLILTTSVTVANSLTWADGIRQTFNPNATNAGINVGSHTAEPSTPTDGDIFYDSTALAMKARINGVWIEVGAGGGAANQIIQLNTSITVTDSGSDGLANFVIDGTSLMSLDVDGLQLSSAIQEAQGTDTLISSNKFTFPRDGNYFESGSTNGTVNLIDNVGWQVGSVVSFRFNTFSTNDLIHDATPSGSGIPLFLIGAADVVDSDQETIYTFRYDGTYWRELARNSLGGGAPQTPWLSDISAAGFDLTSLSNLEFQNTTGAPAGSVPNIHHDPGGMNLNVAVATVISLLVAGTDEYSFSSVVADFKSNDIIGVTDLTLAGNVIFPDGIRQTFNPDATNAGLNVGTQSSPDPTSPVNGDIYYNTTTDKFRAREGGVWKDVLGGSQTPWLSNIDAASFSLLNFDFLESDAATIADAGSIRFGNLEAILWRNFGDTGNVGIFIDADDNLSTTVALNNPFNDLVLKRINFEGLRVTATGISVTGQADIDTFVNLTEIATPANPAANDGRLYAKDVSTVTHLFFLDSAGTETDLLGGSGDVVGPASATNNAVTRYDLTTGKLIQNSAVTLGDLGEFNGATLLGMVAGATEPAGSTAYIWLDAGGMVVNVPTGDTIALAVNSTELFTFSDTGLAFTNRDITAIGTIEWGNGGAPSLGSTTAIWNDTVLGLGFNVPTSDEFRFFINNVEQMSFNGTTLDGAGAAGTPALLQNWSSLQMSAVSNLEVRFGASTSSVGTLIGTINWKADQSDAGLIDYCRIEGETATTTDATASGRMDLMCLEDGDAAPIPYITLRGQLDQIEVARLITMASQPIRLIGALEFSTAGLTPAGTIAYIKKTATEQLINVPAGHEIRLTFNSLENYSFTSSIFDVQGNNINGVVTINDTNGLQLIRFTQVVSAVNEITIGNNITANNPFIIASGNDANVSLDIFSKGTGTINLIDDVVTTGDILMGDRFQGNKGPDVASATSIILGDGNYFDITGTTTINHMRFLGWQNGSIVTLQFDASVTVTHNAGANPANTVSFFLAGAVNFSATADDTLTLVYDGAFWREVCRSVN